MSNNKKVWFKLFACCVVVEGVSGSVIYDLQRNTFYNLPNDFLHIIYDSKKYDISTLTSQYGVEIEGFFKQFADAEIGFYTEQPGDYPDIDCTWWSPYNITNSIIEYDSQEKFEFSKAVQQLNDLACMAVQIRLLSTFNVSKIKQLISFFQASRIRHIELLIPFSDESEYYNELFDLMKLEPRLNRILVFAGPEDKIIKKGNILNKVIIQFKKNIRSDKSEIFKIERFNINTELYSEARNFNLGLNRKVCIDLNGEIKNYLSHDLSFGNINEVPIQEIIEKEAFQTKWKITNDQIEICKDCQYRYACVNNSDIRRDGDKLYKINYCNFDPYTNEFKNQE